MLFRFVLSVTSDAVEKVATGGELTLFEAVRLLVEHRERLVRHRVELNSTLLWHLHDLWRG